MRLRRRHVLPLWAVCSCLAASCAHVDDRSPVADAGDDAGHFRVLAAAPSGGAGSGRPPEPRTDAAGTGIRPVAFQTVPPAPAPAPAADADSGPDSVPDLFPEPAGRAVAPADVMTLAEIEAIALANNPTLGQAAAHVEQERGLFVQAGLGPNPTVGYVRADATKSGQTRTNGLLVQQTFITANKLALSQATERYGIREAQWEVEAQRIRVCTDVKLRYLDVFAAQQRIEVSEELLELAEGNLKAAEGLLRAKQAARTDVLQETVERNNLRLALRNAHVERTAAWRQLAVIAGVPDLAPRTVADPGDGLPPLDAEAEWRRLSAQSPQLRTAEAAVGVAKAQLARQGVQAIPDVTVQVVGQYDGIGDYGTLNSLIALPLPLVDRNQGNIYNAQQVVVRSCREVERVRLVLRDQLAASLRDYDQARNEAETLRDEILPVAKENLDLTLRGYRLGEFGIAAVVGAQRTYQEQRLRLIDAEARARGLGVGIAGLQLSGGGLNPAEIGTAIQGGGSQRRAVQAAVQQSQTTRLSNFAPAAID